MTEVLLSVFRRDVQPRVPEAPESVIDYYVLHACIDFCDYTHWVTYEHDPISLVEGQAAYDFTLPDDNEIARIISAHVGTRRLVAYSEMALGEVNTWRTMEGDPQGFVQDDIHEIRLVPIPDADAADTLKLVMALKPTRTATVVNSDLYDIWGTVIAEGALAKLLALPRQAFTDLVAAAQADTMYRQGRGRAKIDKNRGLATAPQYVRPPRFI